MRSNDFNEASTTDTGYSLGNRESDRGSFSLITRDVATRELLRACKFALFLSAAGSIVKGNNEILISGIRSRGACNSFRCDGESSRCSNTETETDLKISWKTSSAAQVRSIHFKRIYLRHRVLHMSRGCTRSQDHAETKVPTPNADRFAQQCAQWE
jgi:hypothetical protein